MLYVFLPDGVFLPCDRGLDIKITLFDNSTKQSNNVVSCLLFARPVAPVAQRYLVTL